MAYHVSHLLMVKLTDLYLCFERKLIIEILKVMEMLNWSGEGNGRTVEALGPQYTATSRVQPSDSWAGML